MPKQPFDRTIINPREKPLSEDVNIYLAQLDRSLRFFAKSIFSSVAGAPSSGFIQNGLKAVESGPQAMSVVLKEGLGFQNLPSDVPVAIDGVVGLDDLDSYKPLPLLADLTIAIATAPAAPNSRIDIIEVRADRLKTDNQSRQVFDNAANAFSPTAVDKTLEFLLDGTKLGSVVSPAPSTAAISLKQGIAGAPGVAPTATPGYLKIAEVFVDGDVIVITDADITDFRPQLNDRIRHGASRTLIIPAESAQSRIGTDGIASTAFFPGPGWKSRNTVPLDVTWPILHADIEVGARILKIEAFCEDEVTGPARIGFQLYETDLPYTGATAISNQDISDGSGLDQIVEITGLNFNGGSNVMEANKRYYVYAVETTAVNPATMEVSALRVTFDYP